MDRKAFTKAIREHSVHGVYLLEGTEENIKNAALAALRKAILPEGLEDLNETILEDPDAASVTDAAETLPFAAERRLIMIREYRGLGRGEADERLLEYLPNIPVTAIVVFLHRGKADSRKKLYKAIDKLGGVVSFSPLTDSELNDWIIGTLQKAGRSCSGQTASLISFTAGSDTMLLKSELQKLIGYTEGRAEVTDADVRAVITRSPEYTVFLLVDAVVAGQQTKAFQLLRDMLTAGEERIGILAMLLRQYRMLQQVKTMQYEKKTSQQMAELLGIKGFMLDRYIRQAKGISGGAVKRAVDLCVDTELSIKSGRLNQEGALEACMLKLMALRSPGP